MGERALYRADGSVLLRVGALEQLLRYSMNSNRASSVLSSIHDFKLKETELTGGKQWTTTFLRKQFFEKDLEELYRRYDNKLRETLISIYISLLIIFSTIHIVLVIVSTHTQEVQWHSTYISMAMYILRISIPALCLYKSIYNPLKIKFIWIPILVTFIVTVALVVTDIAVAIYSSLEGMSLRPAYATMSLLSVYIFLPMRNNFLAIILGILVSLAYALIFAFVTYIEDPQMGVLVSSDVIYLAGVNIMGIYFRLMNEIVTRRSFLDRRACVESTLSLNFAKEQEERLMLSILPEHIVSKVRQDIRAIFMSLQSHSLTMTMRAFNQLYVAEHDNVSILYADVVNYTKISTTLSPLRMVELLNELFGRFDEASEEHDVLRIKFLGDCYYCVSGVPIPCEQHAKNCVDLGLEMIHIIKDVREKRFLDIDMRIGVHSGRVLCGLIGMRKWQFDIWSKDVTIANKMESTGKSGKVHITKQTLELLLDYAREYIIEPNFESQNHSFITEHKLETYLLSRPARPHTEYKPFKRAPVGISKIMKRTSARSEGRHSSNFRRMTTFMDVNLVEYQRMLKEANAQMAKEIEDISSGKDFFKKEAQLNRFTLMFKDLKLEKSFIELPDPLFKYYILCCFIILSLILLINGLTTKWFRGFPWYTWAIFAMLLVGLLILQPLTWFQFFWTIYKGPYEEPRNTHLRKIYDISIDIIRSAKIRTLIYLLISVGLAGTSVVNVVGCTEDPVGPEYETVLSNCVSSWHVTQCWGLALLLNFLFTRVFFIFKWIVATVMTVFYLVVVWKIKTSLFVEDATWNVGLDPRVSHTLSIVFITITLYWIDRTTEYRNRLDHMWQIQLSEEQVEAETMLKVNNMLLENILPAHVVKIYLDLNRSIDDLYFEEYKNVAVMFASLTDYKLGVEDDAELSDKFILSLMDEVISDFDRLLLTGSSAHKVEKIKMAGWTYMAACGLDLNKRESDDSSTHSGVADLRLNTPYNKAIVLTMVEFAAAMMMQLQSFNRGSFQSFEGLNLRIGISHGEVAAGVIGSLKPLYDIWGNAVNMASRMDSTGETGKIQVTENTAIILDECGILTTNRGETFVKGAGYIKTYFVPLDEDFKLIKKENSIDFYRTEDRNRYFNVKNQLSDIRVSVDSPADIKRTLSSYINTEHYDSDDVSQYSSYVARDLSIDFDGDDEMWTDDDFNYDNSEQTRTVTPSSHESSDYTLSEIEGENTKV